MTTVRGPQGVTKRDDEENGGAETPLVEGAQVGRYVIVRDVDGRTHAVASSAVGAACETDEGTLLMLPGAKLVHVPRKLSTVLGWLDGRG